MVDFRLIFLFLIFMVSETSGFSKRQPVVAGQFYPSNSQELRSLIGTYFDKVTSLPEIKCKPLGVIAPHAGYIFSGQVAAYSYKFLSKFKFTNPIIVLVGESHNFYLKKPALFTGNSFLTPLGEVKINQEFVKDLLANSEIFENNPEVHIPEHSLEVQLPFLQYIYKEFTIVPILVSKFDYEFSYKIAEKLSEIIKKYSKTKTIIIVCSTDMSHYPKYEDAVRIDNKAIELLKIYDPKKYFLELPKIEHEKVKNLHCVFCGETAVGISMITTKLLGGNNIEILKYANSGDVPIYGDKSRVVGYLSAAFVIKDEPLEGKQMKEQTEFSISEKNQKILLNLARSAIKEYVSSGKVIEYKTDDKELLEPRAVFVTLHRKGELRGCIGTTFPQYPLYQAVINMAIEAATGDPRFPPVSVDELEHIKIEISILSPLKRVFSHKDIKEHIHGVVVRSGGRTGLFLPQVWEQLPKKEQFLSHLCFSKAGLPPNAWQDPKTELYVFTVFAFEEK
ncbi:MAG: AmmeMemoRadiSam system protein B [Endomicrobia bacterium]|nr:AmmeMemoRadiSam system protein B [Endomicrobiia bacterium]MDW8056145.1 AmmeMemoRadiSam system protein B [Elusimicrobiota bacterium]